MKIASEHEKKYGNQTGKRPAYDEVILTCRELQSGTSEGAAYEHFGRRTGLQEYIRLSTLLMQNLKRGNSALLERLREEADKAGEERLQQSKRLGEEAGTKLLKQFVREEDGMGTVEIILIIVVLVGLVILFKDKITQIINNLFNKITTQTNKV